MTTRTPVGPEDIENTRKMFGLTQTEMANAMHVPLRTYEDLVASRVNWRPIHRRAAEMGLLTLARARDDAAYLPDHLRELVTDLSKLIDKEISATLKTRRSSR
ncbi:hypothetical protein [Mesorhizobium sp.]|uniref:hypothetical protein n=1 Tax=Mesorhizobium sp. TaxID=1871066 RepID=UPI00120A076A|nr:hypothetical protein [Mesorhizobium sp.]TIO28994.1 MAG: hypothetical protein E5X89_32665 [Mesorhizobium sp.]